MRVNGQLVVEALDVFGAAGKAKPLRVAIKMRLPQTLSCTNDGNALRPLLAVAPELRACC